MPRELVELSLNRSGPSQPWGFRIVGGRDEALVCRVEKVILVTHFIHGGLQRVIRGPL